MQSRFHKKYCEIPQKIIYILLMPRFKILDSFVAKYKTILNSPQNDENGTLPYDPALLQFESHVSVSDGLNFRWYLL
jgi:hypothetical protein